MLKKIFIVLILLLILSSGCTENQLEKEKTTIKSQNINEKINTGNLEISLSNIGKGFYTVLEHTVTDTNEHIFERINKSHYKIYIKVFNPTWNEKETLKSIKLVDNLNNEYKSSSNPDYFAKLKEFGKDFNMYPRTTREGYLFFLDINEKAKKFQLILETDTGESIFKFDGL